MNSITQSDPKKFHGWSVLAVCTLCQFVAMGCTLYLIGIYIEPLAEAFSATPGQIGSASGLFAFFGALLGPFLGYWCDKGKSKLIMTIGAANMAAAFLLLSQARELWHAALICMLLLAPGSAMLGSIPVTVMVAQWFRKRRGLAIGITAAGISAGGFFMPPLAAFLLGRIGLSTSLFIFGCAIALILLPAVWKIAINKPSDIGQYADGERESTAETLTANEPDVLGFATILKNKDFWVITASVGVISFYGILTITYLAPFAKEAGMSLQKSAVMLSVYSVGGVAGKFALGWLCDILPPRRMLSATLALAAAGWLPVLLFDNASSFMATAFSVGFAMGGLIPVWSSLVALNFGLLNFGRVRGIMSTALIVATVLPGPVGGYLYDSTGSFSTAFDQLWWILPAGMLVSLFVGKPQYPSAVNAKS